MDPIHLQLLGPSAYPESTVSVDFKETHISRVYLTDKHVYKLKKPLNLGFLDFSTLDKRRHCCHEEVRLNSRFTDDVYLGVAELRQHNGRILFGDHGTLLDYAVKMRRLPDDRMLDRMIESGSTLRDDIPRLCACLKMVMERSEIQNIGDVLNVGMVRQNCMENLSQTKSAIGSVLTNEAHELMQRAVNRDLAELERLMVEREQQGFVREGHGDLHTANICMTEPVCIYDCIEFSRRYRVADIAADLAFLIMDLEFRGRRDLADLLVNQLHTQSLETGSRQLLSFYKQYRAWVRGKVSAMLANDPGTTGETRRHSGEMACRYFNLALGYRIRPTLFLTSGLMGVGKTTLARALAHATGAKHLRSDVIRKQLAELPEQQTCQVNYGTGLYSDEMTRKTYNAMYNSTAKFLLRQHSVIVDASFARESDRSRFISLANQAGCPVWLLSLECPEDVAMRRLERRVGDASDGRKELYASQKADFTNTPASNHVVPVDTSHAVDYNVQSILCRALVSQEQFI